MTAPQLVRLHPFIRIQLMCLVTYQTDSDVDIAFGVLPLMCPVSMVSPIHKSIIHGAGEETSFLICIF